MGRNLCRRKMADKFERTGLHAVKSERVDAPVITEYPLTLECEVVEMQSQPYGLRVLGKIVNVIADEKVGQAWHSGADLMKKQGSEGNRTLKTARTSLLYMRSLIYSADKIIFRGLFSVFIRTDSFFSFENFSEIIIIGITCHLSDFLQRMIGLCHEEPAGL